MEGRRKALIVANDQYDHEGLGHLLSPGADADALGRVLGDPQIGGFEVQVVRNEPAHVISAHIEDLLSDSRPDDVLLLHFSCHGLKSESGDLFFAARNTLPNRLGSTAVAADFVQRCMRTSRSRSIVLLLDCCYGGAFSQGVTVRASGEANVLDSFPTGRLGGGRGRAVITASNAMEYAFEGDQLADETNRHPSVFTSALVEGMATGEADRDEDGWISLNELYDYVFDRVREQNPHQTPSRDVEMQGELYVARSRRRRVRPQLIPADLRAAMTEASMFSRLGAVTELRSRLVSDNLPVAAGAREALREIADTDIQYVAEAARAALGEAAIRPTERELHFGEVAVGADAGVRVVRLLGPPLARACTAQSSDSWLRVIDTAEGIAVSVDTSRVGTHHGSVTLKGPTGEAVIPIDVYVTTAPEPSAAAADLGPTPPPMAPPRPEPAAPGPAATPLPTTTGPEPPEPPPTGPSAAAVGLGPTPVRTARPRPEAAAPGPAAPEPPPGPRVVAGARPPAAAGDAAGSTAGGQARPHGSDEEDGSEPAAPARPAPKPPAAPRRGRRRMLVALAVSALLAALTLVVVWKTASEARSDRDYSALLAMLPASIRDSCRRGTPDSGSKAEASCTPGVYELWSTKSAMESNLQLSHASGGSCASAPAAGQRVAAALPEGGRAGTLVCSLFTAAGAANSLYFVEWGLDDRLLTCSFTSADISTNGYTRIYNEALGVLRQIP